MVDGYDNVGTTNGLQFVVTLVLTFMMTKMRMTKMTKMTKNVSVYATPRPFKS